MSNFSPKAKAFWPVLLTLFIADFITKRMAVAELWPPYVPHPVMGDILRFTLAYNQGAAMGLSLGGYSRVGFAVTAAVVLTVLAILYRRMPADSTGSATALALIAGGALGNLADRLMSSRGVVDFIDMGIHDTRFYTFNLADSAITCGAILLAIISMKGNREPVGAAAPTGKVRLKEEL